MRIAAAALSLFALAACETTPRPYAPVGDVRFSAMGSEPFWLLTIGDDRIVLRIAGQGEDAVWPRTLPRTVGDVRTWQSGEGTRVITIEARPGPCGDHENRYEDQVRIRLSGHELHGCGGRFLGQARP